jgi:membrane-associated phospholipid phosphatase
MLRKLFGQGVAGPSQTSRTPKPRLEELETRQLLSASSLGTIVRPPSEAYVAHVYDDLLNRTADALGSTYWQDVLGQSGRAAVTTGIVTSPEYQANFIASLYHWYLGRACDPLGLAYCQDLMQLHSTDEQMQAFILGSPEYLATRGGGTQDGFLNALYQDVLNRAPDALGATVFGNELAAGVSRQAVALQVLTSSEYEQDLVNGWYQQFLGRPGSATEVATGVGQLQGGATDEEVLAGLLSRDESFARVTGPTSDVVQTWDQTLLGAIRTDKTAPPQASRAMAMLSVAVFDAVQLTGGSGSVYDPNNAIPGLPAPALPGTSREAAAVEAAYTVLVGLYPNQKATFDADLATSLESIPTGPAKTDGMSLGVAVGEAILAWRSNDGSTTTVSYTPGTGPLDWQPTPGPTAATDGRPALDPQWAHLTPFAMTNDSQFLPPPPPQPGTPAFDNAVAEVKAFGQDTSSVRTNDQTQIALFWADNPGATSTPPGHWIDIADQLGSQHSNTLGEDARLLALVGISLGDAAIVAWNAKFTYNFIRPITFINDLSNKPIPSPSQYSTLAWRPLLPTPNFPTYTSGHSTFSSAAAAVLTSYFGDNVPFTTPSESLPGVTRSFASFNAAAAEAGQSRIYGGIHFQFDNQAALAAGAALGNFVVQTFPGGVG